jgi:hypothetical protein
MHKLLLSIVAVAAVSLSAGRAAAQYPAPYPVQPAGFAQGGCAPSGCGNSGCASVGSGCLSGLGHGGCLKGNCGDGKFGWHPVFQKWGIGGCASGGCSHGLFGGTFHGGLLGKGGGFFGIGGGFGGGIGGSGQPLPGVDPRNAGQLVFPQNPFVRGPRDFFMYDER